MLRLSSLAPDRSEEEEAASVIRSNVGALDDLVLQLVPQLLVNAAELGRKANLEHVARTRRELVDAFGGVTAYQRTPAEGVWTSPQGSRERDDVIMVEVVALRFDRRWWRDYAGQLADLFQQSAIHVRALQVEVLDPDAV